VLKVSKSVLPGFRMTLGFTVVYLTLLVLIPLAGVFFRPAEVTWEHFARVALSPRAFASYKLTIGAAAIAALINGIFGLLVAWVLVRYTFPGRRVFDALVDLPFAMPTAVAGIALVTVYAPTGWIGQYADKAGIQVAFTPLGVIVALTFIGLPFVVRTIQPVLEDLEGDIEEAAHSLGATRWQAFRRVIAPTITPAVITGMTLAFARGLGEYGSVVFISGNLPMRTEITTLLIMGRLEEYDYVGARMLAGVMLVMSFVLLLTINALQGWKRRRLEAVA
jgi:sulfate transport system permease protein